MVQGWCTIRLHNRQHSICVYVVNYEENLNSQQNIYYCVKKELMSKISTEILRITLINKLISNYICGFQLVF